MDSQEEVIHIANVTCDAVFKPIPLKYSTPVGLFIGRICVAKYVLDSTIAAENPNKYHVTTDVHSINKELGHFETEHQAKSRCVSAAVVFTNQLKGV